MIVEALAMTCSMFFPISICTTLFSVFAVHHFWGKFPTLLLTPLKNYGPDGIRTLEERRKFQALVLVYKCIHNEAPRYIEDFFKIKICNYNLRGSGTLLTLPSFNLEWRHKSFSFLAAKLWNSLPTCVRNAKDISTFKRLLKKQVFR